MATITKKKLDALLKKRRQLLNQLADLPLLLHGSYFERFSTCSRPNCRCHGGQKHGPRSYLVVHRDKTQHQVYLPLAQVEAARRGIAQHQRLAEIVTRITEINLELIRGQALVDSTPTRKRKK